MNIDKKQKGQCQCGRIQYRLTSEPLTLYVCHCLHCQKQSSSAFGMSLWMERENVEIFSGELKFWTTQGDDGANKVCAFCNNCGTRIYHASEDKQAYLSIKAGTLNDTTWLQPIAHIWTKRAQSWIPLQQELYKCYEEEPDDEELLHLWQRRH